MASGISFQLSVSMTPPTLSTTTTFLLAAWKIRVTFFTNSRSVSDKKKSEETRSTYSPEMRPSVMMAMSLLLAAYLMMAVSIGISPIRFCSPCSCGLLWA